MRPFALRNQAALPSAADAPRRRQGKQQKTQQQQQLQLLSRPSRRAEVILAATSLLPLSRGGSEDSSVVSISSATGEAEINRRSLLATAAALSLASSLSTFPRPASAAATDEKDSSSEEILYSSRRGFSLLAPPRWLEKSKPGAEVLFADQDNPRATIGVTASPVRIDALSDFGTVAEVGDRLLGAELSKEGCLAATLRLASGGKVPREWAGERASASPSTGEDDPSPPPASAPPSSLYYFEYELLTTRAHKVVVVAVGVASRTLYIFNGFAPCAKGDDAACPLVDAPSPVLDRIRRSASTFSISPSKK